MHRILALLSFETLVLIAALLLYAYVKKNELGKWLQYIAVAIAIFIAVLMVGTVFTGGMHGYRGKHHGNHHKMECEMGGNRAGCCKMEVLDCGPNGNCPMINGKCVPGGQMKEDCCMKGNMEHCQMGGEHEVEVEMSQDAKTDTVVKKVIIKKTR